MEMSLIGEPHLVENTLFVSCPSGKMQPLFSVMVSKLMHHSNLVWKHADSSAEFAELKAVKSPVPLMLFLSICSDFTALPL
jgi:hypothetical protein